MFSVFALYVVFVFMAAVAPVPWCKWCGWELMGKSWHDSQLLHVLIVAVVVVAPSLYYKVIWPRGPGVTLTQFTEVFAFSGVFAANVVVPVA